MHLPHFRAAGLALAMTFISLDASAGLSSDLESLVSGLTTVNGEISAISLGANSCSQLGTLNTSIEDYLHSLETVYESLSAPISLTDQDLTSLNQLTSLARGVADQMVRLSWELRNFEDVQDLFEYRTALSAMLRLSDDIGTMADRILEMADRILVMADNIGLMADRILLTQQLQNANIALAHEAILTTQQNMVTLSDSLSSIAYNLTLGSLKWDTQSLSDQMEGVNLTESNMVQELLALEIVTTTILNKTVGLYTVAMLNSQGASHYINGDTLTLLGDLSTIHRALAISLESYATSIETLSPFTDNVILGDATASMLRLSRDIGAMSNRIMQMTDRIIVMADNIGIMADRIVETQNIQQTNIELTKSSVLTAQAVTVTVIKNSGL